jgi:hypothetical protein
MGYQGIQLQNPLDLYAKGMQIQSAQNQNALAQYQLSSAQRNDETQANFLNSLRGATTDAEREAAYLRAGKGKEWGDILHTKAQSVELGAKTEGHKVKTAKEVQEFMGQGARNMSENPSDANITAWLEDAVLKKFMAPERAQAGLAQLLAMSPAQRVAHLKAQGASTKDLQPTMLNTGTAFTPVDPTSGTATGAPAIPIGVSANTAATNARIAADAAASRAQSERHFEAGQKAVASTVTDNAGNVTHFDKYGNIIGAAKPVGKPSATYEKAQELRKTMSRDLDRAIAELDRATAKGGLIEKATHSGIGTLVDAGAALVGKSTAGAEAAGALAPVYDIVLKMVPRFEGPQSDKDTASYNKAAGDFANPNIPINRKMAAAKEIRRLLAARKDQFITKDMAASGDVPASATPDKAPAGVDPSVWGVMTPEEKKLWQN